MRHFCKVYLKLALSALFVMFFLLLIRADSVNAAPVCRGTYHCASETCDIYDNCICNAPHASYDCTSLSEAQCGSSTPQCDSDKDVCSSDNCCWDAEGDGNCVIDGGSSGGADCNDSSANSCKGQDIGDPCGSNGVCRDGDGDGACTCNTGSTNRSLEVRFMYDANDNGVMDDGCANMMGNTVSCGTDTIYNFAPFWVEVEDGADTSIDTFPEACGGIPWQFASYCSSSDDYQRVDFTIKRGGDFVFNVSLPVGYQLVNGVKGAAVNVPCTILSDTSASCGPMDSTNDNHVLFLVGGSNSTGSIEGHKGFVSLGSPNFLEQGIINGMQISIPADGLSSPVNPYLFDNLELSGGIINVVAEELARFERGYTLCYGDDTCHSDPSTIVAGDTAPVSENAIAAADPNSFASLYWHYTPLPSCTVNGPNSIVYGETANYLTVSTMPVPPMTSITYDPQVGLAWSSTRSWSARNALAPIKDCGSGQSCSLTATFDPAAAGVSIGDTVYISCESANGTLHRCNPFDFENPQPHLPDLLDADCGFQDVLPVTIGNPSAWWQAVGGDVMTNGSVASAIPKDTVCNPSAASCLRYLILDNKVTGGSSVNAESPGISLASSAPSLGGANVSSKNWAAAVSSGNPFSGKTWDVNYFLNKLPGSTSEAAPPAAISSLDKSGVTVTNDSGYYIFHYDGLSGAYNIDADINVGSNKVILIVEGQDLNINKKITLTKGRGFFMAIVEGDINIDPTVGDAALNSAATPAPTPDLEGIFMAEGTVNTGTNTTGDLQLFVRGSVVADDINFERDLGDNSTHPAELFEYAPDILLNYPSFLATRTIEWKEVAP